jgi:hypothetical protein
MLNLMAEIEFDKVFNKFLISDSHFLKYLIFTPSKALVSPYKALKI